MDLKSSLIDLQCELVAERALVNPDNISWLQYDVLAQLSKVEGSLPSQLSVMLGVSRTKLSKSLKDLKALGYVHQFPDQNDGRELHTSISDKGVRLLSEISAKHSALHETALEVFTQDEQDEFARLSEKLTSGLKQKRMGQHA